MLNDDSTTGSELELEVTAEGESLDSSQNSNGAEGETEDSQLNLEEDKSKVDKRSTAEEQARLQVEHWLGEVASGRKALEDAPSWVQKRIESRLDEAAKGPDPEEVVRKVLEQEREDAEFKDLQASIPALTPAQAQELQDRYKTLRPAGKVAALKAALDAMGLNSKLKEAEARGIAKGRMSLPQSGRPSVKTSGPEIAGVPLSIINDEKKWKEFIKNSSDD